MSSDSDILPQIANLLASYYGKAYGALLATGMAAIEYALYRLQVTSGAHVLVPDNCCHTVPAAVCRVGAVPVFVATDRSLLLTPQMVARSLTDKTAAVIAVHQYGLPCPIKEIRAVLPSHIAVIEDAAQVFGHLAQGTGAGLFADMVVSSFGPHKPLSMGGGGGVFGDHADLVGAIQQSRLAMREGSELPYSYEMHPAGVLDYQQAITNAYERILARRKLVEDISNILQKIGFEIWQGRQGDAPCWHRLPIWATTPALRHAALTSSMATNVVQESHRIDTADLPMFAGKSIPRLILNIEKPFLLQLDNEADVYAWLQDFENK